MSKKTEPVRIREIYRKDNFKLYLSFTNDEYRIVDFEPLLEAWQVQESSVEYKLTKPAEFQQVELVDGTLSWPNIKMNIELSAENLMEVPFEIDPIVLYEHSVIDVDRLWDDVGSVIKGERLKSGLTIKQLAKKTGMPESYIEQLENEKSIIELLMIRDIFKHGFGKNLEISLK